MKKTLLALASVIIMASAAVAGSSTVTLPEFTNLNVPQAIQNLQAFGCEPVQVNFSTTAALVTTKAGILYALSASSGTSGDFCVAFDSGSANGISYGYTSKRMSPKVQVDPLTPDANSGVKGLWVPVIPYHYSNGLVLAASAEDINCLACVRPLDGTRTP